MKPWINEATIYLCSVVMGELRGHGGILLVSNQRQSNLRRGCWVWKHTGGLIRKAPPVN